MKYKICKTNKILKGEISLTTSKSISNRLLIIKALCNDEIKINNLSESDDTHILLNAFKTNNNIIDAGHAGTSMRFLTAYLAQKEGKWILTGTERMKKRPIGHLVNGLKQLGADIEYAKKEGFPPLKINGKKLSGKHVKIDGSISSQFISSILLIAPSLPDGLILELENKISSVPYIKLTLELMKYFGVEYAWDKNIIKIKKGDYKAKEITVEADWSGASYWYQMAALADIVDLKIFGLNENSLQGDSEVVNIFELLGVETKFINNGIHLLKSRICVPRLDFNFSDYPDLVQTVVVTCVMKNIPFKISGAESLKIKETDRINALQKELAKYDAKIKEKTHGTIEWKGITKVIKEKIHSIKTYEDHRMAMAFAPVAMVKDAVIINNPEVVSKSYPNFWDDLKSVGFLIEEIC
ncbi:MAG: 3-phosphoshikimate 1-carboxyvinyltransferase [Bacteroidales bacterium]|nr:3-phosphoshikimate 1-carboxyvinyltransferase [Bacteroidales bacterium]